MLFLTRTTLHLVSSLKKAPHQPPDCRHTSRKFTCSPLARACAVAARTSLARMTPDIATTASAAAIKPRLRAMIVLLGSGGALELGDPDAEDGFGDSVLVLFIFDLDRSLRVSWKCSTQKQESQKLAKPSHFSSLPSRGDARP